MLRPYRIPEWVLRRIEPTERLTPAEVFRLRLDNDRTRAENDRAYADRLATFNRLLRTFSELLGDADRRIVWLKGNPPEPPLRYNFDPFMHKWSMLRRELEEKAASGVQREHVIEWLKLNSRVKVRPDIPTWRLVFWADRIAEKQTISKMLSEGYTRTYDRSGCAPSCIGWDGRQDHCECGRTHLAWQRLPGFSYDYPRMIVVRKGGI